MSEWQVLDPNDNPLPLTFSDQTIAMSYARRETKIYKKEGYKKGEYKVRKVK